MGWSLLTLVVCSFPALVAAQAVGTGQDESAAPAATINPAVLTVANRPILTLRSDSYGAAPAERVRTIQERIDDLSERGGPLRVTTQPIPEGTAVLIDDVLVFRVLANDANHETGEKHAKVAADAARNLQLAVDEIREARNASALVPAIAKSLAATLLLAVLLWVVLFLYRRAARAIHALVDRRAGAILHGPDGGTSAGHFGIADLATMPLKLAAWVTVLLLAYQWAANVLRLFPYTRPWGEALLRNLLETLGTFGSNILAAIPGLLFVALIFVVTRFIVRSVRGVFAAIQEGRIETAMFDDTTAPPTGRLLSAIIWLFALVAAYPYLPGSGSEAFKGIGVFVGLMLSIGASGIVNQAVSGLMLMYTRALRPGEFVQIGEVEGTVESVGFLTTRLQTLRQEQISMPNSLVASTITRNYSRLSSNGGLRVATTVTIGYGVPWRQVHAMLIMAAQRVPLLNPDPPPRVLQTKLQDFYVEYTLIVSIAEPSRRIFILSEIHAAIQDVFNEFGVQIMSPNYEADPESAKVVPRDDWYKAPASESAHEPASAATPTGVQPP